MKEIWYIGYVILGMSQIIELVLIYKLYNQVNDIRLNNLKNNQNNKIILSEMKINDIIPTFKSTTFDGHTIDMDTYVGDYNILIFVSPNCEYCKNILPKFKNILINNESKYIVISKSGGADLLKNYEDILNETNIPFIISDDLIKLLKVKAYPIYMVIDKNRKILEIDVVKDIEVFQKYGVHEKQIS